MKKFFKIGAAIFLLLTVATFTSCVNMLYDIDFSGYIYKLTKVTDNNGLNIPGDPPSSKIEFSDTVSSLTLYGASEPQIGSYTISMDDKTVTVNLADTTYIYTYSGNGETLTITYTDNCPFSGYKDGTYTFTYTLM